MKDLDFFTCNGHWVNPIALFSIGLFALPFNSNGAGLPRETPLNITVESEEPVYPYTPANNGAGPMWCHGSTSMVRIGERVYVSGLETIPNAAPLNNCRWMLFERLESGWKKWMTDPDGRTREPSPLACFQTGQVFLSANPTLVADPKAYSGPSEPTVFSFRFDNENLNLKKELPVWDGSPRFTEHSYRSFASDTGEGSLLLLQNIDYTHAEWSYRDPQGVWSHQGQLRWPWGEDYAKPQSIRVCYPNVAIKGKSVHFCGVSDILEPNPEWRKYKKEITGQEWDYDFRRLFYTWTPDITRAAFKEWIEISEREKTGGWISPGDLYVDPSNTVHLLWTERALDERLRSRFFPDEKQCWELNYSQLVDGKIVFKKNLIRTYEGTNGIIPGRARFHVTPGGTIHAVYYAGGSHESGKKVSENRLMTLSKEGSVIEEITLPLNRPFVDFFTSTPRSGSLPSVYLDLLGIQEGHPNTVRYAKLQIHEPPLRGYTIPTIDLAHETFRQIVVDREPGQYLGHPTTVLLEDGKSILCVYPKGHGKGEIVYKRSLDGGKTWSERIPTPENWKTSLEVPTIHRVVDAEGKKRLILWSGLYPARLAVSEDDGESWSELNPVGDWGGIVVMGCVEALNKGPGNYIALFHDDGRFFTKTGARSDTMTLYQTFSSDGGLSWSFPEAIWSSDRIHLCEPGMVRSPDGKQIAILLRENRRVRNSHVMFSEDEGKTWSRPRELPGALTGDRHTAVYGRDGRLFISFRDTTLASPTQGDWVAWVGRYEDILKGQEGQYRVRLMDNKHKWDCAYPGVVLLPNGTIVTTTYGHWQEDESPYIVGVHLRLDELDDAGRIQLKDVDSTPIYR